MSKPQITVHRLGKLQDILRKLRFFQFFLVIDLVFNGHPIFGGLMWYSLRVGKVMFVLGSVLLTLYCTTFHWLLCLAISYPINYLLSVWELTPRGWLTVYTQTLVNLLRGYPIYTRKLVKIHNSRFNLLGRQAHLLLFLILF